MHIEVDQSGKIEQTEMDTIIAFSNSQITKQSKAHEVATNVKRGYAKSQKTLSEKDIEKMIHGAQK